MHKLFATVGNDVRLLVAVSVEGLRRSLVFAPQRFQSRVGREHGDGKSDLVPRKKSGQIPGFVFEQHRIDVGANFFDGEALLSFHPPTGSSFGSSRAFP